MEFLLSIAGFDPTSGAGVTRDIMTFNSLGSYGLGVSTAITFQNTRGFLGHRVLPRDDVARQIESLVDDFPIRYVKTGLIGSGENARLVAEMAEENDWILVVDPLFQAKNSHPLNSLDYMEGLFNMARVITPNVPEAEMISGMKIQGEEDMVSAGERIRDEYGAYVVVKGGHLTGVDYLIGPNVIKVGSGHIQKEVHGTGCMYSSALLAYMASGRTVEEAAMGAGAYVKVKIHEAIEKGGYALPL